MKHFSSQENEGIFHILDQINVVNQALQVLHSGSLKIMLTVPLIKTPYLIRISLYGVHIFHTKYPRVEEYVTKFSSWVPYQHRVLGEVKVFMSRNSIILIIPPPWSITVKVVRGGAFFL